MKIGLLISVILALVAVPLLILPLVAVVYLLPVSVILAVLAMPLVILMPLVVLVYYLFL